MKVESSNNISNLRKYNNLQKTNSNVKKHSVNNDKIEISTDYNIFEKAMDELNKSDSSKSTEELNEIADKIKSGQYEIDTSKIAKSIIDRCE